MKRLEAARVADRMAETLASVTGVSTTVEAALAVVDQAAEATEADIAAAISHDRVIASTGYPEGAVSEAALVRAARLGDGTLSVSGLGPCHVAAATVEGPEAGWLLIARAGDEEIGRDERHLLRAMGTVLALSLQSTRSLESLNERQSLLEHLSRLQRSIAGRTDHQQVLDAIVTGAAELVGDEVVSMRLISSADPTVLDMVASAGLSPELFAQHAKGPIGSGASGRAMRERRLVVMEDYANSSDAIPGYVADGLRTAMAAPILERGEVVGSLVVGTRRRDRKYTQSERDALTLFAEHAGLALNDARAAAETVHQAFHDSLTGLPNRALFVDRLDQALDTAARRRSHVGVLFADIDGFKNVNDSLGHAAGDELLKLVARRLTKVLRGNDTVARFGGDEFAILLEEVGDSDGPRDAADRILRALRDPFTVRGRRVQATASIGIAFGREPADHMLRNADLAMYQAKKNGKGRYETFKAGMHAAVVRRLEVEADFDRALEREEVVLHYQPIARLDSGEVAAVEALARWRHPSRGLLGPEHFIPMAEETRQILRLGRGVLREACRQAALWQARYSDRPGPLHIHVNLSGMQLEQLDLVEQVEEAVEMSGLAPGTLTLEITETGLMSAPGVGAKLAALKGIGVRLAVDDFGTGYSSLEYLRRYPIDTLKVAKPFVDEVPTDPGSESLVQAIVDLALSFGLDVVAEGIEEAGQRDHLVEMGCTHGQGFYFARPGNVKTTEELVLAAATSDRRL